MKRNLWKILLVLLTLCVGLLAAPAVLAEEERIELMYDDRKELAALVDAEGEVTISNEVVTSYKVGSTEKDDHVLVYQDGTLYAVGTGTATLTVGEKSYNVTVSPAPISLFMITGHSIGAGQEGNGTQSVVVEAGQAYSSFFETSLDLTQVDGYGLGYGSANRVGDMDGKYSTDTYLHIDGFTQGKGVRSTASGFAYEWNKNTGEKVWVINIAIGGSCINEWVPGSEGHASGIQLDYYDKIVRMYNYAQTILKNEVAAGHYSFSHQAVLYFSGFNFTWNPGWSQESLYDNYQALYNGLMKDLSTTDIDGDGKIDELEALLLCASWCDNSCIYDRTATWYMASSQDYPKMTLVTAAVIDWAKDLSTFPTINYPSQSAVTQPDSLYHSNQGGKSVNSIYCEADTTHLSQVGYNALGQDIARNVESYFYNNAATAEVTDFRLENYNDKTVSGTVSLTVGETYLMTPIYEPITASNLTYQVEGCAELTYPLAVKATGVGAATLTVKQGDTVLETVTFQIDPAHSHCQCGGNLSQEAAKHHQCSEELTYVPLTRNSFTSHRYNTYNSSTGKFSSASVSYALRGGNYYLEKDYTMSSSIYIAPGETVNLCLNGHKLTVKERAFRPNGNLNICDCSEHGTGSVYANTTNTAPILYSYSGSVVNFYGGTFTAAEAPKREFAGCIAVGNDMGLYDVDIDGDGKHTETDKLTGEVNFYGGKFVGTDLHCTDGSPLTGGGGACVYVVNTKCTLNVYGGEFVGARPVPVQDGATAAGGVIGNRGVTNIYGGTFRDSQCDMGAIWTSNSKLTVSGSPVFENNKHADVFLHYCDHFYAGEGLQVTAPIRIDGSTNNYTQIHLTDAAQESCFAAVDGSTLSRTDLVMQVTNDYTYCECGGTMSDEMKAQTGHTCKEANWSTFNQGNMASRFTTTSSKYYLKSDEVWLVLTSDVNLGYPIEISDGKTLHIDLNGYTLSYSNGTNSMLRVQGKLTICDSRGGGKAVGVRAGTGEAPCVYVLNKSGDNYFKPELHLYSGTLTGFNITSKTDRTRVIAKQAGVLQIGNNSATKDAKFFMYGGTVTGGIAGESGGGNVYLAHGIMNLYDGVIENGTSTASYGGNVRIGGSNFFTMYGGIIRGGTTKTGSGGNIFISSGANKILGGTVENGWAATNGGNVYLGSGTVEISNATFLGGAATNGGNMYLNTGTANITDTVMEGGMAGFAFVRNADGTLEMSTTDAPTGCAGTLYINDAEANLTDCTLTGGVSYGKNGSNGFGGNIYNKYRLTMDNCTVSGGDGFRGGVVGIRDHSANGASYTELKNCTFFDNSASVSGSSVGLWANKNGAEIVIDNCTFDDSMNETRYGVLAFTDQDCTAPVSVTIKDSKI